MKRLPRKTAPRVRNGRAQRKNRCARTPNYFGSAMPSLVIDRRRAGRGYRHIVRKDDVRRFLDLLPDRDEIRCGLNAVVLDGGGWNRLGWHRTGVIAICAWVSEIEWEDCDLGFFQEHSAIFEKLAIPVEETWNGQIIVRFTAETARAFLLTHVLVHELGHHHDRMTTRSRRNASRGEGYAEAYARRNEDVVIRRYRKEFSL